MDPFPKGTRVSQWEFTNPGGYNPPGGHTGRDYAVPAGTPVRAAADGVIRNSSWFTAKYDANPWWLTPYGGDTLVLDCTDAFGRSDTMPTFVYAHLSDSTAPVGKRVKKGEIIGYSGNSGTATSGPHCHVERLNPGFDLRNNVYGRSPLNFDEFYTGGGIAAQGTITTPAAPALQKEQDDMLVISQPKGSKDIWIGNGVERRRVPDVKTLQDYRKLAAWGVYSIFKNGEVMDYPAEVLGADVEGRQIEPVQAESIAKRAAALVNAAK